MNVHWLLATVPIHHREQVQPLGLHSDDYELERESVLLNES